MKRSSATWLNQPVPVVPSLSRTAESIAMRALGDDPVPTGFAVTTAGYREFVRAARLRPYIAGELRRWRAGRDLVAVGAAIRTAIADAEWPLPLAEAIAAGYARLGGDGTAVTVRGLGGAHHEVFHDLTTTDDVLAACKRCFAAPFTDQEISDREDRGVSQLDLVVSIGIERQSRPAAAPVTEFAPSMGDCAGYVVDTAEIRRLAVWAIAVERNQGRRGPELTTEGAR